LKTVQTTKLIDQSASPEMINSEAKYKVPDWGIKSTLA
jgi:hypothetical protein